MNRRQFVKSGAGILAAASMPEPLGASVGRSAIRAEQSASVPGIDFDFTGLFGFRLTQTKEMRLFLLNAKNANLEDEHAPLLMMPFEYYDPSEAGELERADPPNVVRLGDAAMAIWSLAGLRVWVPSAHTLFGGTDNDPSLKFDETPVDPAKDPDPIDKDAGWASRYWFVKLPDLLKEKGSVNIDERTVASTIRLTRGSASGRAPRTQCEQQRKYIVDGNVQNKRSFATQLHVVNRQTANTTTRLAIAPPALSNQAGGPKFIGVKIGTGLTPISIFNSPLTHFTHDHYKAFYKMVGRSGRELTHDSPCIQARKAAGAQQPSAPYPDCIPPDIP